MNLSNNSSDAVMMKALKVRAIARVVAGTLVIFGILVVAGSHDPSSNDSPPAATGQVDRSPGVDAGLDRQLQLDPAELMFYSSNVHG